MMNSITQFYDDKDYYRDVIQDILNYKSNPDNFYKLYYGEYAADANKAHEKNEYIFTSLNNLLSHLELDIQLNLNFYNYNLKHGLYDNVWAGDASEYLQDQYNMEVVIDSVNTYNYESVFERIIQFEVLTDADNDYLVLQVHGGAGDARCHYSYVFIYIIDDYEYIFDLLESCYIYIENCELSIDVHSYDYCTMYNINTNEEYDIDFSELEETLIILKENNISYDVVDFEY